MEADDRFTDCLAGFRYFVDLTPGPEAEAYTDSELSCQWGWSQCIILLTHLSYTLLLFMSTWGINSHPTSTERHNKRPESIEKLDGREVLIPRETVVAGLGYCGGGVGSLSLDARKMALARDSLVSAHCPDASVWAGLTC
jgi:hypothetical protein